MYLPSLRKIPTSAVLFVTFVATACAGNPGQPLSSPATKAAQVDALALARSTPPIEPTDTTAKRIALFDHLVADVRRYHLFAPQTGKNLGKAWEDDLPRLRAEFVAARSPEALSVALVHFGNSLHDVHCQFRPEDRGPRIKLGFDVGVEEKDNTFEFFLERVANSADSAVKNGFAKGDVIVSVDGVPAAELVRHHDLESNMNSWTNIARQVGSFLTNRRAYLTTVREGTVSTWVVRSRDGGAERTIQAVWHTTTSADVPDDIDVDYETQDCLYGDPKNYGPYKLRVRGYRTCIYTSTAPRYRDYPIVRQVSFRYDEIPHGPIADHDLIQTTLARLSPKGVLLDVQENGGGINPNLFLDWWADKPYTDTETRVVLDDSIPKLTNGSTPKVSSFNDALRTWYSAELGARTPGQHVSRPRPFQCKAKTCDWDNRYVPRHRVTRAPVALLVGPGCASSCDSVAWHFDRSDFGPIVGRAPMAGFTTHRLKLDVALEEKGPRLGTIDLAIAYDSVAGEEASIEAKAITIDVPVPRTFENHEHYDALLVNRAIEALSKRTGSSSSGSNGNDSGNGKRL